MLRNLIYTLLLLVLVILYSCEDEIELNDSSVTNSMVINSFINPDSVFTIELSETKSIAGTSTSYTPITDATVTLYEDDTEKGTLSYTKNTSNNAAVYESNSFYPVQEKTYRIEVSNSEYNNVSCETSIPYPVKIESLDSLSNDDSSEMTFQVTFKDSANFNNYYRIMLLTTRGRLYAVWNETTQTQDTIIKVYSSLDGTYLDSDDPILVGSEDADDYLFGSEAENVYNIFSDEQIDGKTYTLDFNFYSRYFSESYNETERGEFYKLTVLLQSISYDEYMYLLSYANYSWNYDDGLTEPVQVYSNIDNGTGIFAGYSTSSASVIKGEFPMDGITYTYDE